MSWKPAILGHGGQRRPAIVPGAFVLNGAGAITDVSGAVKSVKRLVTATPTIVFRVTLDRNYKTRAAGHKATVYQVTPAATTDTQDLAATVAATHFTVAGETPNPYTDVDVVIRDGGVAVDTAGIVVNLLVSLSQ